MRTLITFGLLLSSFAASAQTSFGDITGTIFNKEANETVFDATVYTVSGDAIYRAVTDPDGRFRISAVPPGTYQLSYIYENDTIAIQRPAEVSPDGIARLDTIFYNSTTLTSLSSSTTKTSSDWAVAFFPRSSLREKNTE